MMMMEKKTIIKKKKEAIKIQADERMASSRCEDVVHTVTKKSILFWHPPSFSNWTRVSFELDGVVFTSSEQTFMYLKALFFQ